MIFVKILTIAIISFLATLFLPWYFIAIVSFLVGFFMSNIKGNSFISGFLGIGIFWAIYIFYIQQFYASNFPNQIALLFSDSLKKDISATLLTIITVFLGALIGGLSALAGSFINSNVAPKKVIYSKKSSTKKLKIRI